MVVTAMQICSCNNLKNNGCLRFNQLNQVMVSTAKHGCYHVVSAIDTTKERIKMPILSTSPSMASIMVHNLSYTSSKNYTNIFSPNVLYIKNKKRDMHRL